MKQSIQRFTQVKPMNYFSILIKIGLYKYEVCSENNGEF